MYGICYYEDGQYKALCASHNCFLTCALLRSSYACVVSFDFVPNIEMNLIYYDVSIKA